MEGLVRQDTKDFHYQGTLPAKNITFDICRFSGCKRGARINRLKISSSWDWPVLYLSVRCKRKSLKIKANSPLLRQPQAWRGEPGRQQHRECQRPKPENLKWKMKGMKWKRCLCSYFNWIFFYKVFLNCSPFSAPCQWGTFHTSHNPSTQSSSWCC